MYDPIRSKQPRAYRKKVANNYGAVTSENATDRTTVALSLRRMPRTKQLNTDCALSAVNTIMKQAVQQVIKKTHQFHLSQDIALYRTIIARYMEESSASKDESTTVSFMKTHVMTLVNVTQ